MYKIKKNNFASNAFVALVSCIVKLHEMYKNMKPMQNCTDFIFCKIHAKNCTGYIFNNFVNFLLITLKRLLP